VDRFASCVAIALARCPYGGQANALVREARRRLRPTLLRYRSPTVVAALFRLVHHGRDRRARAGTCSVYQSDSVGALAVRRNSDDRRALCGGGAGASVALEYSPKRNSELIGIRGSVPTRLSLLSLGELRVYAHLAPDTCSDYDAVLRRCSDHDDGFVPERPSRRGRRGRLPRCQRRSASLRPGANLRHLYVYYS
jgi:hypothetical protein